MAPNVNDIQIFAIIQVVLPLCVLGKQPGINEALHSVIESEAKKIILAGLLIYHWLDGACVCACVCVLVLF